MIHESWLTTAILIKRCLTQKLDTMVRLRWLPWPLHLARRASLAPSSCAQSCPGPFISSTEWLCLVPSSSTQSGSDPWSHRQSGSGPYISRTERFWPLSLAHRAVRKMKEMKGPRQLRAALLYHNCISEHYISYISYFSEKCKKCKIAVKMLR